MWGLELGKLVFFLWSSFDVVVGVKEGHELEKRREVERVKEKTTTR